MGPSRMTVALAMYWLAGVVGAASLPPDDQYSPQRSLYKKDTARGPRGYQNWLEYHQDPSTGLEPSETKPGITSLKASDLSRDRNARKDSVIRDLDLLSPAPRGWNVATTRIMRNFTGTSSQAEFAVPDEGLEILSSSPEDSLESDETFQDQGPGSIEVYKLDLHRENSLLVPQAKKKQPTVASRIKGKIPKKAKGNEILWQLEPIEPNKTSLPAILRHASSVYRDGTIPRESLHKIEENRKEEVFAVGGVPELQVGCEGLEASDRKRRSSGSGKEYNDEEYWPKFKEPVYRESTEPILLRVTPIVLDFEDEPPAGQIYEELDELLKLKSTSTPEPTNKRTNRGDIDPAVEYYQHEEMATDEKLPERGDLGSSSSKDSSSSSSSVERSSRREDSRSSKAEGVRFPREANGEESLLSDGVSGKDDDTLSPLIGSRSENLNHRDGRKLLWVQYPERHENQVRTKHHQGVDDYQGQNLWGFAENDGIFPEDEDESEADKLRKVEEEKRRREYERRKQEDLARRRGGHDYRPHSQEHPSRKSNEVDSEIERIRKEYERQQEREQRERQRIEEERRRQEARRQWEHDERRMQEAKRRQWEESQRRMKEEERRNRDPSQFRRREEEERRREWNRRREEEEERRIRLEDEKNNEAPPSPLTRPSPYHRSDNRSRNQQEEEERRVAEERKLREYIERNRPIDVKKNDDRGRLDEEPKRRNEDEERRKHIEAQRRRRIEEERIRQREEEEKRRQMEEYQRRQESPDENERRRQIEEQRRRERPNENRAREEERKRRLEEERKFQEYVRRNQPVNVPRRNISRERDWQEQRRTLDEARKWEQNRQQIIRSKNGRSHGPSAPTNIGQHESQGDLEELRRRQETQRLEAERRRFEEDGRRREEEYRREKSRRYEEERRRLEEARRAEESNRRRPTWQDSHHPTGTTNRGGEVRDREAGELQRHENSQRIPNNSRRNQDDEWRRRSEEHERRRQHQQQVERERLRIEHERNARINGRRRMEHGDTGPNEQRKHDKSVRNQDETERRRREEARLSALPVSARIIIRSDTVSSRDRGTSPLLDPSISIGSRDSFGNEIDFPNINPYRPGLNAAGFPAPALQRPSKESPSNCIWAIVNCCPANNRLTACFESMGCPGINWDPDPCRAPIQSAARAQVLSFYESVEDN